MKIKTLNEAALDIINTFDRKQRVERGDSEFQLYYYDSDNNKKILKTTQNIRIAKKAAMKFITTDKDKLDALDATAIFIDDQDDEGVFSAFKNDDGVWEVEEDKVEELEGTKYVEDEYKNTLLNQIVYSLTHIPANLAYTSPQLYKNLFKIPNKFKITTDIWGYHFNDNGDAVISIQLDERQVPGGLTVHKKENDALLNGKINALRSLCDHYGVALKEMSNHNFQIIVPDQLKYETDIFEA